MFYTATIRNWEPLLCPTDCKNIIINSLKFLVCNKRIILYGFVIMDTHIHLIWQATSGNNSVDIQSSFSKFTATQLKKYIAGTDPTFLECFKVNEYDRDYRIWKRNPLSIELFTRKVGLQKLNYIHNNPVKAGLCRYPEDYAYSSAQFYYSGRDEWGMLSKY